MLNHVCLAAPPLSPLNQILMNKLYNNALFMRFQNRQKKFLQLRGANQLGRRH